MISVNSLLKKNPKLWPLLRDHNIGLHGELRKVISESFLSGLLYCIWHKSSYILLLQKQKNEALNRIMGELSVQDQDSSAGGDDLLDLMDSA